MIDFNDYLIWGGLTGDYLNNPPRAAGVNFMAGYTQGLDIVLTRSSGPLAAQRVIVAPIDTLTPTDLQGAAAKAESIDLLLIGPRNHPTLPSFNVQRGDRFSIGTARYEVVFVDTSMNGKTEAHCASIQ